MGAVVGNILGAGAQGGHRHLHFDIQIGTLAALVADEGDVIVHHAFFPGHRRVLVDEVGEAHLDMAVVGFETLGHLTEHGPERIDGNLVLVRVEDLHEAGHVRALEVVRQVHVHAEGGHRALVAAHALLDRYRVAYVADPDLVDRQMTLIGSALDILDLGTGTRIVARVGSGVLAGALRLGHGTHRVGSSQANRPPSRSKARHVSARGLGPQSGCV